MSFMAARFFADAMSRSARTAGEPERVRSATIALQAGEQARLWSEPRTTNGPPQTAQAFSRLRPKTSSRRAMSRQAPPQ